jgi:hypothetical protein
MPYTPPTFRDWDPRYPVDAEALAQLGGQHAAALEDVAAGILDQSDPIGAAVAQVASSLGGGGLVPDPADEGVFVVVNPGAIAPDPSDEGVFLINGGA